MAAHKTRKVGGPTQDGPEFSVGLSMYDLGARPLVSERNAKLGLYLTSSEIASIPKLTVPKPKSCKIENPGEMTREHILKHLKTGHFETTEFAGLVSVTLTFALV